MIQSRDENFFPIFLAVITILTFPPKAIVYLGRIFFLYVAFSIGQLFREISPHIPGAFKEVLDGLVPLLSVIVVISFILLLAIYRFAAKKMARKCTERLDQIKMKAEAVI